MKCLFGWTYFEKLLFITVAPLFAAVSKSNFGFARPTYVTFVSYNPVQVRGSILRVALLALATSPRQDHVSRGPAQKH